MSQPPDGFADDPAMDAEPVPLDPTGLDVARQIAQAARHAVPPPPAPRKPRREPRRPAAGRSSKGDPMAVGDALDGLIRDRGWTTEVSAQQLLGRWASLVGQVVAEHTTPEAFRDGVVAVRADSTAWASQLRLLAPQVVAKLNAALGDGTVKRIQVLAPEAPSWKHGIRSVRDGRGPRDTYG